MSTPLTARRHRSQIRAIGPRVVCAPDKMRDALTAPQAASALADGVRAAGGQPVTHPVADGGEGSRTIAAAAHPTAREITVDAIDALGRPTRTAYTMLPDGTAVIEAAEVIGLAGIPPQDRDIFAASSAGLAGPLRAAAAAGCSRMILFLGGTATMDGGLGLLTALGCTLNDPHRQDLSGTGRDLTRLATLDVAPARAALSHIDLLIATDVQGPLAGPGGAAVMFAPQKGADPGAVTTLDHGLARLAELLGPPAHQPGAGAAGGLGAALLALGGHAVPGADLILDLTGFDTTLAGAALCLTAEGRVDAGSTNGKAVSGVLNRCVHARVPCVILGGTIDHTTDLYTAGAAAVLPIGHRPQPLPAALNATGTDLQSAAFAMTTMASRTAYDAC